MKNQAKAQVITEITGRAPIKPALLLLLSVLVAFAAPNLLAKSTHGLDPRYEFEQFDTVDRFNTWSIDSWYALDQRSLMVRTSPSTSYLLILDRRLPELRFNEAISLSSTGASVYARFDSVRSLDRHGFSIPARIDRIYKIKGKENRRLVRDQIKG